MIPIPNRPAKRVLSVFTQAGGAAMRVRVLVGGAGNLSSHSSWTAGAWVAPDAVRRTVIASPHQISTRREFETRYPTGPIGNQEEPDGSSASA
jgi:hypothetical protein